MSGWDRDTPWRQGRLLPVEVASSLGLQHTSGPQNTIVIVASHDCDLASPIENEPMIEVVVGQVIEKHDGNLTHAKNPRRLHINFKEKAVSVEFEIVNKVVIPKKSLIGIPPRDDLVLSIEEFNTFQHWLASRYRRSAFSNQFESRLQRSELDKKIARALKPHGDLIVGIFFDVDQGSDTDRPENEPNELSIILLHQAAPDFEAAFNAASDAANAIQTAFETKLFANGTWESIELISIDVISEEALSYFEFKMLKSWRVDYLSLADTPQQAMPAIW